MFVSLATQAEPKLDLRPREMGDEWKKERNKQRHKTMPSQFSVSFGCIVSVSVGAYVYFAYAPIRIDTADRAQIQMTTSKLTGVWNWSSSRRVKLLAPKQIRLINERPEKSQGWQHDLAWGSSLSSNLSLSGLISSYHILFYPIWSHRIGSHLISSHIISPLISHAQ